MPDVMNGANSGANSEPIPPKRKPGNPNLRKGGPSLNPSGKAKPVDQLEVESLRARVAELEARERARESAEADSAGGVVTAARMRKVLGQDPPMDCGPTEQRLREWLEKGVGPFVSKIRELEAEERAIAGEGAEFSRVKERLAEVEEELGRLKAKRPASARDEGSARAEALIDRILAEIHE